MRGSAHAVLGAAAGFIVAQKVGANPEDVLFLTGAGVVSGLIPDLDTGGKLANRISVSNKYLNAAVRLIGILLGCYAYFFASGMDEYISFIGAFILLFVLPQFSKKFMLLLSGVVIAVAGYVLMTIWIQLIGVYVMAASLLAHRSYTHSLLGLAFYGVISYHFAADFPINGLFTACVFGYISHLIADMRFIPGNKKRH
ncbi:metal-dependent hydrolase [Virgibacillus halophilus]|uniref:Metal-dependent hydrolase n=1 Tax=Tigheibacillus halophilus TaxID=361280 RepID=A0ABU5C6X9_9BACI|nr:metal-dependent hydrolase [Virgibacillus halophilus]